MEAVVPGSGSVAPACPRCGYDLSGAMLDWGRECPLRGMCPECGLRFAWREVFSPERQDLPWFFEHARRVREMPVRLVRTLLRTLWPLWFWSGRGSVRLEHRVRPWLIVLWGALMLGGLHAGASTMSSARWIMLVQARLGYVNLPAGQGAAVRSGGGLREWSIDDTRRLIGSWTHPITRVAGIGGGGTGLGGAGGGGGFWLMPLNMEWPWYVHAALGVHVGFALMLWVLPHTRAASGLRSGHVLRGFVYGLTWLGLLAGFRLVRNGALVWEMAVSGAASTGNVVYLNSIMPEVVGVVLLGWIGAWWLAALSRGWRLPNATALWVVLAVPSGLLGMAVWAYVGEWRLY